MIQAIIATIIEMMALLFAMAAGMWLEEYKQTKKSDFKIGASLVIAVVMAACALGVAAR